jgi:hypothetical protein
MNMCRATFAILLLLAPSVRVLRAEDFPPLPYGAPPIDYFSDEAHDPIAELASRWDTPETRPPLDPQFGRLPALLRELKIPVSSQLLVMSKTSVQQHRISPSSPRALYFRDDITVAYVAGGPDLEVTAHDSRKGTVFYLVLQRDDVPRIFSQPRNCTSCHVSRLSLNIPGHLLKSFVTDPAGHPLEGYSGMTHATPFEKRWGGWMVTGRMEEGSHLGNRILANRPADRLSLTDEPIHEPPPIASPRLAEGSDLVAHLVFNHQMEFRNLVNRLLLEHRLERLSEATIQAFIDYALMTDETPLPGPVVGNGPFAVEYQQLGIRDPRGRSLRDLDLQTRLFRYRLSPMLAGMPFQKLPTRLRESLLDQIDARLAATDDAETAVAREVARATVPGWKSE